MMNKFEDLIEDLMDIGAFDPDLEMMIKHISQCETMHLNPKNPLSWKGYVIFYSPKDFNSISDSCSGFTESHKYKKAIEEARLNYDKVQQLAEKYGMEVNLGEYDDANLIVKIPNKLSQQYLKDWEKIVKI